MDNIRIAGFAAQASLRMERRAVPPPPRPVVLVADDEDDMPTGEDRLGYAEGQSFMIEYESSSGELTSRRITVFGIRQGASGVAVLHAKCHERNAQRMFRVDRILSCIDYDGEVHDDVPAFMSMTFGMHPSAFDEIDQRDFRRRWERLRVLVRPQAVLFAALSRSDGLMRPDEVGIAMDHCCHMAMRAELEPEEDELAALSRYITRQRPGEDAILSALEALANRDTRDITRFLASAVELIDIDGMRHPGETAMLNDLSSILIGLKVV